MAGVAVMTEIPPPHERPTMQELAAQAGGLKCPRCGFASCPVLYGQHDTDSPSKWRKRECRRCGTKFWTQERVLGEEKDSEPEALRIVS
jgi:DNA-directed RNA polymerase subunit RPC12/RpoP